jgi:hypothetical protein
MAGAKRVVTAMAASKVPPNERTFGHLVWGYGQLGDMAGLYNWRIQSTRSLKAPGFNPLDLKSEKLVSKPLLSNATCSTTTWRASPSPRR